jgi:hypothetical protein
MFLEYFPWKKSEFPSYDCWILSDADDARIFRQGWAARGCGKSLEDPPSASHVTPAPKLLVRTIGRSPEKYW